MADQWFVQRDGRVFGPYTPSQFAQMAANGQVRPTHLVSARVDGGWVSAAQIEGLFPAGPVVPQAAPVTPTGPASPFAFKAEEPTSRPAPASTTRRPSRPKNLPRVPVPALVAGGLLLLILIGGGVYMATRDRSAGPSSSGGPAGARRQSAGRQPVADLAQEGMPLDELLGKVEPPVYSWSHKLNASYQNHVWDVGSGRYVLVVARDNRVKQVQNISAVYFENLKKSNAR